MSENPVPPKFEDKIQAVTRMPPPDPDFVDALWRKLESPTGRKAVDKPGRGALLQGAMGVFRSAWQWGLSLAALSLVVGLLVFSLALLPEKAGLPQASPAMPTASLPVITLSPEPTEVTPSPVVPTPVPIPNRLVDGACQIPLSQAFAGQYLGQANQENVENLAGGGQAISGDFTFEMWLACSAVFGRQDYVSSHYSAIDNLGFLVGWTYHGPLVDGEVQDYQGVEPYVQARGSTSGALSPGGLSVGVAGLEFPAGVIPDFSRADTSLRYLVKVHTPDGKLAGAALTFTLQRQPGGYKPVNVQVAPLSAEELQTAESPAAVQPPFPTLDPGELYPELRAIRELLDRYQDPLRSSPGWLYMKIRYDRSGRIGLYGSLTEWIGEQWFQIDAAGYVPVEVHIDRSLDGNILQQSYSKDGESYNLTYGIGGPYTPYRLDLGGELYIDLFRRLEQGKPIDRQEITVDGKTAWAFTFTNTLPQPAEIDNVLTAAMKRLIVIDLQSGAQLYSELVRTTPDGQEQLVWRMTYETVERIPRPPEEVSALLGQAPGPYQPPSPSGTLVPPGFDPSQSELSLQSIPGDRFDQPTFWYGDIYAGGYLLGRVDFGGSPGGYCDRSADGSKLAFNYLVPSNVAESHEYLRWLDLSDISQVFEPAPNLEMISKVAWAPQGYRLAFSACKAGRLDCGLYLLDAASNQVSLLSDAGVGFPPPLWKPDGSQIAFVASDIDNVYTLHVVDAASGQSIYQGPFDPDAWQPASDAPTLAWGMEIPRGYTGSDCFKAP